MKIFKIEGIYNFVKQNKELFTSELFTKIPYDTIINYRPGYIFDITNSNRLSYDDSDNIVYAETLIIQTRKLMDNNSQSHVLISEYDSIVSIRIPGNFDNNLVTEIIIDTYKVEMRNKKIEIVLEL